MPYIEKEYKLKNVIEIEKYHSGRYGKQVKVGEKKKVTPEQMKKSNMRKRVKYLRRLIKINFDEGDIFMTLTYRREERPGTAEEAKKILAKLMRNLRGWYKRRGYELKYILVTEYMKTAIHHHIIINNIESENIPKLINSMWKYGRPNYKFLDDGSYEKLAAYLLKDAGDEDDHKHTYTPSRNLIKPTAKTRIMKAKDWRKEPKPKKGYYIDKNSVMEGISEITGYRYQSYIMIRLDSERRT